MLLNPNQKKVLIEALEHYISFLNHNPELLTSSERLANRAKLLECVYLIDNI